MGMISEKEREVFKKVGSLGGQETLKRYGTEHFKKLRKLSSGRKKNGK